MNPTPCRPSKFRLLAGALATATFVHAHPGHDGHELTWDLLHWLDHPLASLFWVGMVLGAGWGARRLLPRLAAARSYSLRGSHPSRGK